VHPKNSPFGRGSTSGKNKCGNGRLEEGNVNNADELSDVVDEENNDSTNL
jgi:hypothetical protein